MKKLFILFILSSFGFVGLQAQTVGNSKIKRSSKLVWLGLDFSEVQCIGRAGFVETDDIADRMVFAWNDLIIKEHDKYNVHEALKKDYFKYDLMSSEQQNEKVSAEGLVVAKAKPLDHEKIESIISNYSCEEYPDGLGVVFIVEELNKTQELARIHATFFEIDTKEIVQSIKYETKPGGFGFRNFWARSFLEVINQMEGEYKKWYKKNK